VIPGPIIRSTRSCEPESKVTRLDRLSRSVLHLVTLGADLRARKIGLHVTEQGIDTDTVEGRAMFGMLSVRPVPLRRNSGFQMLWIGQLLSDTGSQIGLIADPLLILLSLEEDAARDGDGTNSVGLLARTFAVAVGAASVHGVRQVPKSRVMPCPTRPRPPSQKTNEPVARVDSLPASSI
jgi:hypothetical protein